jgi:hypothetical protein
MNGEERTIWISYIMCDRYFWGDSLYYIYSIRGKDFDNKEYYHNWGNGKRNKTIEDLEAGSLIKISDLMSMIGEQGGKDE